MLVHAFAPWSLSSGAINVMNALRGVVLPVCTLQMMRGRSRRLLPRWGSAATSGRCETALFFLVNFPYTGGYDKRFAQIGSGHP
jgi:hypothetical protein